VEKPVAVEELLRVANAYTADLSDGLAHSQYAARAQCVIERRYAEPALGVRTVARAVGISTQHLSRLVKRQLDVTVADLLRHVRLPRGGSTPS
jgi:AraC-like DNA-binding protein